ncbi:hypothetical protein [Salinispora vitiensis]|uniref:hypothetical protein n=1 Tax=Salinispora vitiensis TaxID=999544 RepID=UPI00036B2EFD|nr:hypothetical protein [Salinispora vitiensis]
MATAHTSLPLVPAALAQYLREREAARAATRAAVNEAIRYGGDTLRAEGQVPYPRLTPELNGLQVEYDRAYQSAARAAARQGRLLGANPTKVAALWSDHRPNGMCPVCAATHAGWC